MQIQLPPIVRIVGGLIVGQDGLTDVQNVLHRNTPADCPIGIGNLTGQMLKIARSALETSHVFLARFKNGEQIAFVGDRLPPNVTEEAAVRAVMRE